MHGLSSLQQGDHVCAIYDDAAHQLSAIADYVKSGLDLGERILYIVDDRSAEEVLAALTRAPIDVRAALGTGRLVLMTKRESYLRDGSFNPDQMVFSLSAMTDQALADGCTGLRVSGEMTWALGPETGCDRLMEYETKLNQFFPGSRASAICQYNRERFPAAVIREVLRQHPIAVIGHQAYDNPYFEPADILGLPDGHQRRVDHMIASLVRHGRAARFSTDLTF